MALKSKRISLNDYAELCQRGDVAPNYHPSFVDYYFGTLKRAAKLVGRFDSDGRLRAAFPVVQRQVFPNPMHKRLMKDACRRLGDIGQPEMLFPVVSPEGLTSLSYFSPTTSPLLSGHVRGVRKWSLKSMAIAKTRRHKKLTHRKKAFLESGGEVWFSDSLDSRDFADIYTRLYCERWGCQMESLTYVREQIRHLYAHVFGTVLVANREPVAAQLCFSAVGENVFYVDFINSGVKIQKDNSVSYGSVMLLCSLRRAEAMADTLRKQLRYSFGYDFGPQNYKSVWTDPEATFIAF